MATPSLRQRLYRYFMDSPGLSEYTEREIELLAKQVEKIALRWMIDYKQATTYHPYPGGKDYIDR